MDQADQLNPVASSVMLDRAPGTDNFDLHAPVATMPVRLPRVAPPATGPTGMPTAGRSQPPARGSGATVMRRTVDVRRVGSSTGARPVTSVRRVVQPRRLVQVDRVGQETPADRPDRDEGQVARRGRDDHHGLAVPVDLAVLVDHETEMTPGRVIAGVIRERPGEGDDQ